MTDPEIAKPIRAGLCACGQLLDLTHIDNHRWPVRCAVCGRETYAWQLAIRATRHAPPTPPPATWEMAR